MQKSLHNVSLSSRIIQLSLILFLSLVLIPVLSADPEIDNNAGCWTDNFNDQLGTVVANSSNIEFDVFAGTVSLVSGQASGIQQSVVISPPSFDSWLSICLDANYSGASDLTVDVLDPATDTPVSGYSAIPISSFTNGCYDISAIDIVAYPELKIRINHTRGGTAPVVNQLSVKWNPITFLLFDKVAPPSVLAGQEFRYKVRISANFVDAQNVVIYDQLPLTANGTVIYESGEDYGQSDNPVVNQISDDGIYTATATTINGIAIPANSVYWTFDKINAGVSKILQFYVKSPNGTLDGTIWENTAQVFTTNGENQTAAPVQTVIKSNPAPRVSKEPETTGNPAANMVYPIGGTNYIIGGDIITYQISGTNGYAAEGRERMHNTVMWDNLSDLIDNGLIVGNPTNISGGGIFTATATTVGTVNIPANSIYWNYGTFHPGNSASESFQVQTAANPTVQSYTNYVFLDSDQTNEINNSVAVQPVDPLVGLPGSGAPGCKLGYFSSYSSGEQDANCSGADGGVPLNFGDPVQYRYSYANTGGGELEDVVFYDMVPAETQFVDASFNDPTGLLTGSIYYYEDLTGTFTDNTMPPAFDWTTPVSGGWSATKPVDTNDPGQTIWVAWHVEGLTSPFVDADPTRPTSASITLDVIPLGGTEPCEQLYINNTALTHVYQTVPQSGGAAQTSADNTTPILAGSGSDVTQARSPIGQFKMDLSNGGISGNLFAPAEVTFSIDVCNEERTTSAPFISTDLVLSYQGIMVNGTTMYPDFVDVSGGVVTNFDPANGTVTLSIGPMIPGDCKTATLTIYVPEGIIDLENVTIGAAVTGYDPDCGAVSSSTSRTIPITAVPILQVYKDDVLNVIGSGEEIEYDIYYRNIGESPSTNTWVVDRIPFKTTFVNALGMNGEQVWFTSNLPPDMPANQISVIYPIDFSTISANFSLGIKDNNGTPADFTDDVWTSPFGDQTTWIAFKVDDPTLNPVQVPVDINFRKTTFTVQNDEDGTGPNTAGSPEGTVIFNEEVIFSEQNLMAVGNEVRTTIEDFPGLELDKRSSLEVVNTGQAFDWIVDYRNNSVAKNDVVTITDVIPKEFTLNTVSHEWNAAAGGGGITNISADGNVTITNNPDGSTTVEILVAGSPGFRPDLLTNHGGTFYFNVQAKAETPCGALIFNEVTGFSSNMGGDAVVSDDDPVTVFNPDVYLSKSVSNAEPKVGDVLTYTLGFGNRSIIEAAGVIIRDTLPAGFTYVSGSSNLLSLTTTVSEPTVTGNILEWNDLTVTGNPVGTFPAQFTNNYLTYEVEVGGANGQSYTNIAGISTTSPEKNEFPNQDSATVFIPHPDPSIQKTGPAVSAAGESVVWELIYLNRTNADATGVYIIESLPDVTGNGADVTFVSTSANGPSTVTPYYTATAGTAPTFDPTSPTTNGWSATPTSPVNHIAYSVGDLPALSNIYKIQVSATLIDAVDGSFPTSGTEFLNRTEIFSSSVDTDPTNNTSEVITRTPGIDLAVRKTGSLEGAFPGARPGDEISYELVIANTGTEDAYGVSLVDMLPDNFVPDTDNFDDFTTAEVVDETGESLFMLNASGSPVNFAVPVTRVGTPASGATVTWYLGTNGSDTAQDYYRNLAIPPGGQLTFTITGTIDINALDGDRACNEVQVNYEGLPSNTVPEEFVTNNIDSSKVNIWRPDVTIKKTVVNEPDGDETWTEAGDVLVYNLEYNNIGNANADNTCIQEIIPPGTSYVPSSLTLPPGATVEFSPNATTPTNFEVCIPVLPAPPNFDGESAPYNGATDGSGIFDGTDSESIACTDKLDLFAHTNTSAFTGSTGSQKAKAGDVDGDGDLDIIAAGGAGLETLWLNDGAGNFTQPTTNPFASFDRNAVDLDLADFDNDGDLDVVFACSGNQNAYIFLNDGAGGFTYLMQLNVKGNVGSSAVGDFNGDGNVDIAIGRWNSTIVYLGNGDATFGAAIGLAGTFRTVAIEAGDFNGDGFDDLVVTQTGGSAVGVIISNGNGTFSNPSFIGGGNLPAAEVADLNGDGNLDAVGPNGYYPGNGDGTFGAQVTLTSANEHDAFDYDNDGDIDVVSADGGDVRYFENNGTGGFSLSNITGSTGSDVRDIAEGDFDGDGFADIVLVHTGTRGLELFTNTSSAPYKSTSYYETTITSNNNSGWDRLLIDHSIAENASIEYALYAETADDDGNVLNDTPLWGPQAIDNGYADISAIPATNSTLILRANISSDGVAQACLNSWTASYISPDLPSLQFKVQVNDPAPAGQTTIDNTVTITTTTPEINYNNNDSEDNINIRLTDLAITKSVDKSAVQAPNDETITYTLDWEVLGPQSAINAIVQDVLPTNVSYQSAVPAPTTVGVTASGQDILTWDLGAELNVGTSGSIVVTTNETAAVAGDNLTNVTSISNDRQETDYTNNDDNVVTIVGDYANVYIEKDGSSVVDINGIGQYQLTYGNNGNLAADNVMVIDDLPAGFTPVMTDNGACTVAGQNVTCNLGTLAVGATGTILVDFQVANDPNLIGQTLNNIANITTTTPETDISDNNDDHDIPIFLLELAGLSGTVWHDDNRDGVIDPTEKGIESVMIILTGLDIFGVTVQDTAWTNVDGEYSFAGLVPGTYNVEEVQPTGWLSTTTTGTDAVTNVGDVTDGSPSGTTTDVGTVGTGSTSGANEATNTIVLQGGDRGIEYNFGEDLGAIGNYVWYDSDIDGIQDTGDTLGVYGVAVYLYDLGADGVVGNDDNQIGIEVTDSTGYYIFEDLLADDYYVQFDLMTLPDDFYVSPQDQGADDALDSDVDSSTGLTTVTTIDAGEEDMTWDMGIYGDLSIGNYVWLDTNQDGIQDAGETPAEGVNVTLFTDAGVSLATVQTDANGLYYFSSDTLVNAGLTGADAALKPYSEYYIVVGTGGQVDNASGTLSYNGLEYQLTIDSTGTMATDSDGELANELGLGFDGLPFTLITTPGFGQVDTTFDFGFYAAAYDYGDLPDTGVGTATGNYATSMASNGPSHLIVSGLLLGATIDEETDGQSSVTAEGDDTDDGNDDEDGLILPTIMLPGGSEEVSVITTNDTGERGYVRVWIDWNNDGDFDDANEMVIDDGVAAGTATNAFTVTAPNDALIGTQVGVRVRLSNQRGLSSVGPSSSGEVEDYLITIGSYDFPNIESPCNTPPCHIVGFEIYLGSGVTGEVAPGSSGDADDGLLINENFNLAPGVDVSFPVSVYNNTGETAYLTAWADWNGNGDFEDAGEQFAVESYDAAMFNGSFIVNLPVTVPADVTLTENIALRFRVSTDEAAISAPCGTATCTADGEVEDYLIQAECKTSVCSPIQLMRKSRTP